MLRSNTQVWLAGGTSTAFSFASNFGAAVADDNGQELVLVGYTAGEVVVGQGTQGLNTRQALPPALASSSCVIENGNLYLFGGYTGTDTLSRLVHRLAGV